MAKVTFHLKGKNKEGLSQIRVSIYLFGHRLIKNIGYQVHQNEWDKKRQAVNIKSDLFKVINEKIDYVIRRVFDEEKKFIQMGKIPNKLEIEECIFRRIEVKKGEFYDLFEKYLSKKKANISSDGFKIYSTLRYRLNCYSSTIETIDDYLFDSFESWCKKKKYSSNTIIKHIGVLKDFCKQNKIPISFETTLRGHKFDSIALSEDEIKKIWLNDVPPYLENTKIRFVFMCYTGMRITDSSLFDKKKNIIVIQDVECVSYISGKQKKRCVIPVNISPLLGECIKKGWKVISEQRFRIYIKELCLRSGLTDIVEYVEERGGFTKIKSEEKYKLVTPHTARRSFVTNMFYRGYPPQLVKTMSGHSLMEILEIYDKTKPEENAIEISKKN